jgi:hippurate hydrolase
MCASSLSLAQDRSLGELYEHLHRHPELSFQEQQTAEIVAAELKAAGFTVTTGLGGDIRSKLDGEGASLNEKVGAHGVVAVLSNGAGPAVLLRTDMDGLPVQESTGLAYASNSQAVELTGQPVSVMHACGHDIHMTSVIGAARELARRRGEWSGTLLVIGQQAEERGSGARMLLGDGLFERFPRPDYNLALHVSPSLPAGSVGYVSGWMMASVDSVDITVHGVGAHGAYPQAGKDPIVLAAAIIMDLQTLVSREVHPLDPAVVTVGSIHAGAKHNIISDRAELQLTVRSYSDSVRQTLLKGIERIALNQARALGLPEDKLPEVSIKEEFTPSLWNDPELTARAVEVFKQSLGTEQVIADARVMGGEDFSLYSRVEPPIPSLMFRLGSIPRERYEASQRGEIQLPSLHSPFYYPDPQPTIATGVKALTELAIELFN